MPKRLHLVSTLLEASPLGYGPGLLSLRVLLPLRPDSPPVPDHPGVLFGRPFGDGQPRGSYRHRRKLDLCCRRSRRDTVPDCCLFAFGCRFGPILPRFPTILGSFSAGFSAMDSPGTPVDIGENSNSVGGVPVGIRSRIALSLRFAAASARFSPGSRPSRGPFRPAFRRRTAQGLLLSTSAKTRTLFEAFPSGYGPGLLSLTFCCRFGPILPRFPTIPGSFSVGLIRSQIAVSSRFAAASTRFSPGSRPSRGPFRPAFRRWTA
jgi:hypothetical protein